MPYDMAFSVQVYQTRPILFFVPSCHPCVDHSLMTIAAQTWTNILEVPTLWELAVIPVMTSIIQVSLLVLVHITVARRNMEHDVT